RVRLRATERAPEHRAARREHGVARGHRAVAGRDAVHGTPHLRRPALRKPRRAGRSRTLERARARSRAEQDQGGEGRAGATRPPSSMSSESVAVDLGTLLPIWSALPFAGMLLSIALFPLLAPSFWHHHYPKVSAAWAIAFAAPFVVRFGHAAVHELL